MKLLRLFGGRSAPSAPSGEAPAAPERHAAPAAQTGRITTKWLDLEYGEVPLRGKTMRFATTGSSSRKRLRSLFSKEPITLAWIDSFGQGETLHDIGANVGMYTVYAAVMRDSTVYAFEPEALNYAELNKNIFLNDLDARVLAYCVALSDVDKADRLLLSDFGIGISYHDFEENSWTDDKAFAHDWVVRKDERRQQGCIGRTLDSLIREGLAVPDHIKIDVDGLEHRVIGGMLETLKRPELKTVLVEINFDNPRNLAVIETFAALGWRFSWEQLRINRSVKFSVEKIKSYQDRGVGGLNYIFYRDEWYDRFFADLFDSYTPGEPLDTGEAMERAGPRRNENRSAGGAAAEATP